MSVIEGPEFYISKRVGRAIMDYKMISDGDKIAVAVSGGKDSLTLLKILIDRLKFVPITYEVIAVHIDLGFPRSCAKQLEKYFKKIKVRYHIEKVSELRKTSKERINCFWCSWNRRKALFGVSDRLGCSKVALGHHKDDIAETILMNIFFHAEFSAMSPNQELFHGRIRIIRPMAYVEESLIRRFVKSAGFKTFDCKCPQSSLSNRATVGGIISKLEKICPEIRTNICKSAQRVRPDYLL
jgi:tRNA 2-thiocytidine biosynthesis protein TtcA